MDMEPTMDPFNKSKALVEITLSILLFSPELIIGVVRLVNGAWAQVKGKPNWQPQDAVEKDSLDCQVMGVSIAMGDPQ